ncbi:MAG: NADH:ubiquinone reductase (Na(+)-transporting) subunit C [Candidatus Cloacimonadota bacterium]|nr:MAG: NADH:ubiquinone reductase (Na(+)-transporting) subunit C [Candidatus Cloacimonadota bacterium]PIE80618.1 MAG: NADH:ubiquinone reductase (Na(+)-transporting) subunit C [Candidatus Delongbacteria bacterium]
MVNKESNLYTLVFASLITIFCAVLLSFTSFSLKEKQEKNLEVDSKKNILKAVTLLKDGKEYSQEEILDLYKNSIEEKSVDDNGNFTTKGNKVYIAKKDGKIISYCIPIEGKGLWSTIYGYMALEKDCNRVKGITFYKHGETPGLGGEISQPWFMKNYIGKEIFNSSGELASITILKGKVNLQNSESSHQVDGISGATLTCKGVNKFIKEDLTTYKPFFNKIKGGM